MKIKQTDNYVLLKYTENSIEEFKVNFDEKYPKIAEEQIIIDFSEKINTNIEELFLFLDLSTNHRENGISFVIICSEIDTDDLPDEICVVPTFSEALDILEMDEIERDLGF